MSNINVYSLAVLLKRAFFGARDKLNYQACARMGSSKVRCNASRENGSSLEQAHFLWVCSEPGTYPSLYREFAISRFVIARVDCSSKYHRIIGYIVA
jgi:hypothetical protein